MDTPEATKALFDWATLMVAMLGVLVTAAATAAAITAGLYAKGAWREAGRQATAAENSLKGVNEQLAIAKNKEAQDNLQHERWLAVQDRERKNLGPLFQVAPTTPVEAFQNPSRRPFWLGAGADSGVVFSKEHTYGQMRFDELTDDFLRMATGGLNVIQNRLAVDNAMDGKRAIYIMVRNTKETASVKAVRCRGFSPDGDFAMIPITSAISGLNVPAINTREAWLLELPAEVYSGQGAMLQFSVETQSGFEDVQRYSLQFHRVNGLLRAATLVRVDPRGVEEADLTDWRPPFNTLKGNSQIH